VTPDDFEISASLRARRLVVHVPPEAETRTSGDDVTLDREDAAKGLSKKLEPGGRYNNVSVEKRLRGRKQGNELPGS
jgi:hypothetical protein